MLLRRLSLIKTSWYLKCNQGVDACQVKMINIWKVGKYSACRLKVARFFDKRDLQTKPSVFAKLLSHLNIDFV